MIVNLFDAVIRACVVVVGAVACNTVEIGGFVGADGFEGNDIGEGLVWINTGVEVLHRLRPVSGAPGTVSAGRVNGMFDFFADLHHTAAIALKDQYVGEGFKEVVEERVLNGCHGQKRD